MADEQKCWCGSPVSPDYAGVLECEGSVWHDPIPEPSPEPSRLYVAGPMSGYEENNYPAFNEAAERLRAAGFSVVNPAEYGTPNRVRVSYQRLLIEDIREMLSCEGIAVLESWWSSVGARNEVQVAGVIGLPVRSVDEWISRSR